MIDIYSLVQTCVGAPSQWEAVTDRGCPVYIRYRHGELSVRVGPEGGTIMDAVCGTIIFDQEVGEGMGSMLLWEEVMDATGMRLVSA